MYLRNSFIKQCDSIKFDAHYTYHKQGYFVI